MPSLHLLTFLMFFKSCVYSDRRLKRVNKMEVLFSFLTVKETHVDELVYIPERAAVISGKPEAVAPLVSLSPDGRSGRV